VAAIEPEAVGDRAAADAALLAVIAEREASAFGNDADPVSTDRATAIDYYLGQPFGNEIEGRSQVVSKDLFDTVEWIKPSLLRIFAGGDRIASFSPQGPEDVQGAEQESDYVDFVIQRKNNWFLACHTWFTDALLTRNAYLCAYWETREEPSIERYQGLTDDQLALIGLDRTVEIVEHSAYPAPAPVSEQAALVAMQQGAAVQQATLHDVVVRRTQAYGCAKLHVLPPERCMVGQDCAGMSVREASFFEYWEFKTLSELRVQGFAVPDDISDSSSPGTDYGLVDQARDVAAVTIQTHQDGSSDPSMRKVKQRVIWVRNDYDGDGRAELRHVIAVGDNILYNAEVASIPVASIVPYPMPHRHIGLSMYDAVGDLQLIRSAMLRAGIDNQFLLNNGRVGVDKNTVVIDDLLVSRPLGVVRVDGPPAGSIMPFQHPDTVASTMRMLDYLDGIRQDRGGVQKPMAGADMGSITAQPGTIAQLTSAASQKIELIARVFAEGVKEAFAIVHELTLTHATSQDKAELRGQWVTVDPRAWKKRSDMTISVGLGIGNRAQHAQAISALLSIQEKVAPIGLCDPGRIYNALAEYTKALGFATPAPFFAEPKPGQPFPQPQPPYQLAVAQMNAQADVMVQAMKNSGAQTVQQIADMAQASRTYFETMVDENSKAQERFLRAVSEATDRMQEMRLDQARGGGTSISIDGGSVGDVVKDAVGKAAAQSADGLARALQRIDGLEQKLDELKKPKKRTVKAPSGKVYTVQDQ